MWNSIWKARIMTVRDEAKQTKTKKQSKIGQDQESLMSF